MKITNFVSEIGSVISRRGKAYWEEGRVEVLQSEDNLYRATVHGTLDYTTTVVLNGDTITHTSCNCPYGSRCKHVAALLYEIRARRKGAASPTAATPRPEPGRNLVFHNTPMPEKELFCLCYMAFSDYISPYLSGVVPFRGWHFTITEHKKFVKHLTQTGWLRISDYSLRYQDEVELPPQSLLYVLQELVENRPEWLRYFRAHYSRQAYLSPYILDVLEVWFGKKQRLELSLAGATYIDWSEYTQWFARVFSPLVQTGDLVRLHDLLPEFIFFPAVLYSLNQAALAEDSLVLAKVGMALSSLALHTAPEWWTLHLNYRLYFFLATGQLPPLAADYPALEEQAVHLETCAIRSLYENRLDEAIALFQKSFKVDRRPRAWQLMPYRALPCFCYVIALGRRRKEEDVKILRKLLKRSKDDDTRHLRPIFPLANYFQSTTQEKDTDSLLLVLQNSYADSLLRSMAMVILYFFGKQKLFHGTFPVSHTALLQAELSAYDASVQSAWPYPPLLSQVPIYEAWELELDEILREAQSTDADKAAEKAERQQAETRLIYCYDHSDILEVREQPRLKNGTWGKGKKVSAVRYANQDLCMDEVDQAIHAVWRKTHRSYYSVSFPLALSVLPAVKGTDRLYYIGGNAFEPITVREEQPFLFTRREGNQILFSTNIPSNAETYGNMWVDRSSYSEWVYYVLPESKHALFERILHLGSVPAKAEPTLKKLFGALQGQFEVHSDVEGAEAIRQVEGQSLLTLRITPAGEDYTAELRVYPVEGNATYFFPAGGDPSYYDLSEGKRIEVVRAIPAERRALRQANAVFEDLLHWRPFTSASSEQTVSMVQLLRLLQVAPEQASLFQIEWCEGAKIAVNKVDASSWHIAAHQKGGWFDIEGKIPLSDGHIVSMAQLLTLLRESKGNNYIRLSDTDFVAISDALRRQLERLEAVSQTRGGKVQVPELAMSVLGGSLQGEMEIEEPDTLLQMRERIRESEQLPFAVPDGLNATLRDYQIDGFRWMMRLHHWGAGACLADDMGLGKTIQTIAVLLAHADEGVQMVVAPASVVGNWQREIARFAPSLTTVVLNDIAADDRAEALGGLHAGDVLVLTYGLLVSERESLTPREWVTVCLDEAHTIKNRDTKSSAAAMQLRARNRIILTGTPIQNHLGELWNLMQFINPGLLGSYDHFTEHFVNPIAAGMDEPKQQLKRLIAPFTLRRTKQEVARELPDKMEIQVPVTLSDDEMAVYEVLRREAKAQLEAGASVSVNTLSMITRLREAACSVALVENNWTGESSKLEAMLDKLQSMVEQGNRVLLFSQFTSFLKMAKQAIEQAGITDLLYLDGSTPLLERQRMVDAFQSGKGQVFLISLKAGGLGLNLTGANYVIHLDPWWNPAIEQQATDRAYRIGQKQKVTVYHLIAEHTIEEKILRLHQTKQSLADSLLDGTNLSHRLTAQDLLALLS